MSETITIGIRILDNEYQASCPESEADELAAAARDLDTRMRHIQDGGKVFGVERIAVMAALNAIYENRRLREQGGDRDALDRVTELTKRLEHAIGSQKTPQPSR